MAERNARGGWDITDEEAAEIIRNSGLPDEEGTCCGGGGGSGGCGCGAVPGLGLKVTPVLAVSKTGGGSTQVFKGYRPQPPVEYAEKGITNSGSEPDYEGIIFSDGTIAVRWLTRFRSTSIWASWDDFMQVHGHPEYGTSIVFEGEEQCHSAG